MGDLKRLIKRWEKYVMIAEIIVDRHCIKNPKDKAMLSARAYLHTIRRQIRNETGYAQSTLPTILDFARRNSKERIRYLEKNWGGYLGKLDWNSELEPPHIAEIATRGEYDG